MSDFIQEGPKGTMTSESYTRMVEQIETEIKRVKAENNPDNKTKLTELKKEKRALKNKASAMRCREKKRRRMEDLEKIVEELNAKLNRLEQENKQLRAAAAANGGSAPVVTSAAPAAVAAVAAPAPAPPAPTPTRRSVKKEQPAVAPAAPRIHYSAPQKRRASDLIITDSPSNYAAQPTGGLEKSTKMSHSRTHAVTTGSFSEADLDFPDDVFANAAMGGFGEDADAFLSGDALFWDEGAGGAAAVDKTLDTFIQGHAGRSLVGAL